MRNPSDFLLIGKIRQNRVDPGEGFKAYDNGKRGVALPGPYGAWFSPQ